MNNLGILFPLIILALFVPMLLGGRRQKRQAQEMQKLQSNLVEGDVVTTTSGLRGTVADTTYEETVDLEIAPGVVTTWLRAAVREKVNPETAQEDGPSEPAEPSTPAVPAAPSAPVAKTDKDVPAPGDSPVEAKDAASDDAKDEPATETGTPARDRGTA
jgi:preprotein translocase subunit YajC